MLIKRLIILFIACLHLGTAIPIEIESNDNFDNYKGREADQSFDNKTPFQDGELQTVESFDVEEAQIQQDLREQSFENEVANEIAIAEEIVEQNDHVVNAIQDTQFDSLLSGDQEPTVQSQEIETFPNNNQYNGGTQQADVQHQQHREPSFENEVSTGEQNTADQNQSPDQSQNRLQDSSDLQQVDQEPNFDNDLSESSADAEQTVESNDYQSQNSLQDSDLHQVDQGSTSNNEISESSADVEQIVESNDDQSQNSLQDNSDLQQVDQGSTFDNELNVPSADAEHAVESNDDQLRNSLQDSNSQNEESTFDNDPNEQSAAQINESSENNDAQQIEQEPSFENEVRTEAFDELSAEVGQIESQQSQSEESFENENEVIELQTSEVYDEQSSNNEIIDPSIDSKKGHEFSEDTNTQQSQEEKSIENKIQAEVFAEQSQDVSEIDSRGSNSQVDWEVKV